MRRIKRIAPGTLRVGQKVIFWKEQKGTDVLQKTRFQVAAINEQFRLDEVTKVPAKHSWGVRVKFEPLNDYDIPFYRDYFWDDSVHVEYFQRED